MKKSKKLIILLSLIIGVMVIVLFYDGGTSVVIGNSVYKVTVANTPESQALGLSGREGLRENEGMLFIFEDSEVIYFWMKDMLFALDMIWIDENKKIVGITENVQPDSFPESFSSKVPVKYVLEINSGGAERSGLKVGDIITFSK